MLSIDDLLHLLTSGETVVLDDVKNIMLRARHDNADLEDIQFANSLLQESGDYLPSHLVRVLIRAELSDEEAKAQISLNKKFFKRLGRFLPALVGYFKPFCSDHIVGVLRCIDDCHSDYLVSANSLRKDRLLREAEQSLEKALEAVTKVTEALEDVRRHLDFEYRDYYALYFPTFVKSLPFPPDVDHLIQELKLCSGVLNIVSASGATNEDQFYLSGNDKRRVLVGYAHMMSLMWNGPKLVTTPGSDFSTFCGLLFESITGIADESLAGAINRYARSEERKKRDAEELEFKAEEDDNDNFLAEKRVMKTAEIEIERCKALLNIDSLSDIARTLLLMNIDRQTKNYAAAQKAYGPRQVWLHQMNDAQLETLRNPNIDPRALAKLDRALGDARRTVRGKGIDI
jgi:hypothetical protein